MLKPDAFPTPPERKPEPSPPPAPSEPSPRPTGQTFQLGDIRHPGHAQAQHQPAPPSIATFLEDLAPEGPFGVPPATVAAQPEEPSPSAKESHAPAVAPSAQPDTPSPEQPRRKPSPFPREQEAAANPPEPSPQNIEQPRQATKPTEVRQPSAERAVVAPPLHPPVPKYFTQDHPVDAITSQLSQLNLVAPGHVAKSIVYHTVATHVEEQRKLYAQNPVQANSRTILAVNFAPGHAVKHIQDPPDGWFKAFTASVPDLLATMSPDQVAEVLASAAHEDPRSALHAADLLRTLGAALAELPDPRTGNARTGVAAPTPYELRDAVRLLLDARANSWYGETPTLSREAREATELAIPAAMVERGKPYLTAIGSLLNTVVDGTPPELEAARSQAERTELAEQRGSYQAAHNLANPSGVTVVNINPGGTRLTAWANNNVISHALPSVLQHNVAPGQLAALALTGVQNAEPNALGEALDIGRSMGVHALVEGTVSEDTLPLFARSDDYIVGALPPDQLAQLPQRFGEVMRNDVTSASYGRHGSVNTGEHGGGSSNWESGTGLKPKSTGSSWNDDLGRSVTYDETEGLTMGPGHRIRLADLTSLRGDDALLVIKSNPVGVYDATTRQWVRPFPPEQPDSKLQTTAVEHIDRIEQANTQAARQRAAPLQAAAQGPDTPIRATATVGPAVKPSVPDHVRELANPMPKTQWGRRKELAIQYGRANKKPAEKAFDRKGRPTKDALEFWHEQLFLSEYTGSRGTQEHEAAWNQWLDEMGI